MNPTALFITALVGEFVTLIGILIPVICDNRKKKIGQRCLLRSKMLDIYYANQDKQTIRQYESENFIMLYEAYKSLKGNSFVDNIYNEVKSWKVIT